MQTTKTFGESTVSKIINLVENANENKSKSESFISRFAHVYTPIVVFLAVALALVPPIFSAASYAESFSLWLNRALIFLVVSCPCALVISVPLTFFGGIGGASRNGILIKGSNYMDALANLSTVVFDKTGTLTHGQFEVEAIHPENYDAQELLHMAAHVEHFTTHPIGVALRDAFPNEATDGCEITEVEEIAGQGIRAKVGNHTVCVGNTKMMNSIGAKWHNCHKVGTIIHIAIDGIYAGHIIINDKIKEDSKEAISQLKALGVGKTVMLTGSDAAIEAADVVLMDDKPSKVATAISIARRTIGIAHQNVWFAIGVKVAILLLATVGLGTMWMAVFADVGVTVLAVLNAMRALKVR